MNKYPHQASQEERERIKESYVEQCYSSIIEDADRIEKYIEENSDVIQDIIFKCGGYQATTDQEKTIIRYRIGCEILDNVLLGIENMAESDAEMEINE